MWRAHAGARDVEVIYRISQVSSMREGIDGEIAAIKVRELPPAHAHHLMVEALKHNGRSTIVTYRYVWSDGTNAKEVATLTGNPPRIQSKVTTKGAVKLKVSYSVKPLGRRPALPLKSRGSLKPPVPSPFCTK